MVRLIEFVLATAGASVLSVFFFKDLSMRFPFFDRKPFTCPLCTGFYIGYIFWFLSNPKESWEQYLIHGCVGAVGTWGIYWKVTGGY